MGKEFQPLKEKKLGTTPDVVEGSHPGDRFLRLTVRIPRRSFTEKVADRAILFRHLGILKKSNRFFHSFI